MSGTETDHWSTVATGWERLWGRLAEPVWAVLVEALGIGPGTRVLDVGCGSGDLLVHLTRLGAVPAGIDAAPGMVARSRDRLPGADIRLGAAEHLPWPGDRFDVVTAVNAVQFADDTDAALAEIVRVTVPGGHVAVSNWAEGRHNDLDTIEDAVARAEGEEPLPDGDLRHPGGLEELVRDAGLVVVRSGLVETPWSVPDDDTLIRGVLLGEDPDTVAAKSATVVTAARPFRTPAGGYRLVNAFRYAVGRRPG